jgi:hypothetical protein
MRAVVLYIIGMAILAMIQRRNKGGGIREKLDKIAKNREALRRKYGNFDDFFDGV